MSLITIILTILLVGVLVWLITTFIPMEPKIKQLLVAIVMIFLILWLLQGFGLLPWNLRIR